MFERAKVFVLKRLGSCCHCCRFPWLMRTDIPPLLQYPVGDAAFPFVCGLISMFYGLSLLDNLSGLWTVISCFLGGGKKAAQKKSN